MNTEISSLVIDGNEIFNFIDFALTYINISDFEFRNCDFLNEDMMKLIYFKNFDRIAFINCSFENEELIKNIKTKSLSLTNNKINSYEFIYDMFDLENLTIVGGNIDAYKLNSIKNLIYLRMSNSKVVNIEQLVANKLKYLFIDNSNIEDISFVKKFPSLELLSISDNQKLQNKEILFEIKDRVRLILDSIIEMELFLDE